MRWNSKSIAEKPGAIEQLCKENAIEKIAYVLKSLFLVFQK